MENKNIHESSPCPLRRGTKDLRLRTSNIEHWTFINYLRFLNIDIILGVVSGALYASSLFQVHLPWEYWFVLPCSVWILYAVDHLLDSRKKEIIAEKYSFIRRNQKIIVVTVLLLFLSDTLLIFKLVNLDPKFLTFGISGAVFLFIYLLFQHFFNNLKLFVFQKELIISLVYIYGIFGIPAIFSAHLYSFQIIIMIGYFLMVLSNVYFYSIIDADVDASLKKGTIVTRHGLQRGIGAFLFTIISSVFVVFTLLIYHKIVYGLVHLFITIGLLVTFLLIKRIGPKASAALADFFFILPGVVYFFVK